jgi:hypothetical protein
MLGKNLLWVAKQHGHSVEVMLRMYAAWLEGATEADIHAIKKAMEKSLYSVLLEYLLKRCAVRFRMVAQSRKHGGDNVHFFPLIRSPAGTVT